MFCLPWHHTSRHFCFKHILRTAAPYIDTASPAPGPRRTPAKNLREISRHVLPRSAGFALLIPMLENIALLRKNFVRTSHAFYSGAALGQTSGAPENSRWRKKAAPVGFLLGLD